MYYSTSNEELQGKEASLYRRKIAELLQREGIRIEISARIIEDTLMDYKAFHFCESQNEDGSL
jgi:hypothetical protein